MLFSSSYKILCYGYAITFFPSFYSPSRSNLKTIAMPSMVKSTSLPFKFVASFVIFFITNHLRNHRQIDVCLVELTHMNEPYSLSPLHFLLLHCLYHAMHAIDKINRFKIFRLNKLFQLLYPSTL
jgi:hypothetical protein